MLVGTWKCKVIGYHGATQGIQKIKVGGDVILTVDKYAAVPTANKISTSSGFAIGSSGVKAVQVICDGKNPSSGGYKVPFQEIVFYRTA